jgi:hyperosmotically inducible periplasmic protein
MTHSRQRKRPLLAMALTMALASLAAPLAGCATVNGQESASQYAHDASLTAKVKANIIDDQSLKGFAIGVETMRGTVQLSGFVDTMQQKVQAATIAWAVPGVQSVRNDILVSHQNGSG